MGPIEPTTYQKKIEHCRKCTNKSDLAYIALKKEIAFFGPPQNTKVQQEEGDTPVKAYEEDRIEGGSIREHGIPQPPLHNREESIK